MQSRKRRFSVSYKLLVNNVGEGGWCNQGKEGSRYPTNCWLIMWGEEDDAIKEKKVLGILQTVA